MSSITLYSLIGLVSLLILSYICGLVFKIHSNKFYRYFHLLGGALSFIFVNSIIQNLFLSLISVFIIGIAWEIFEWFQWKYLLKKDVFKPRKRDTVNDLVLNLLGALFILLTYLVVK